MRDVVGGSLDLGGSSSGDPMKLIHKAIMSQGIQSPEELQKFINERLVGRPIDELAAEFASDEPQSDLERAEYLMDGLDEDTPAATIRHTAEKALEISPLCLSAWLALGANAEDPAKALGYLEQGIEKGRERFAELIDSLEDGHGLWGWIEARDFMRLLHNRARVLEALADFDQAIATYREIIALNPGDNQGVRGDLLHLLITTRQNDAAHALLNQFSDDGDVAMAYGGALLEFMEAMDRAKSDDAFFEAFGPQDSPPQVVKKLGPEYDKAKKLLKRAVKLNPFVPYMITHPQIMGVETSTMRCFGGPYEAVGYVQERACIWYVLILPFIAITASMVKDPMRNAKSKRMKDEFIDIIEQLESLDDTPWWESFDSDAES